MRSIKLNKNYLENCRALDISQKYLYDSVVSENNEWLFSPG